MYNNSNTPKIVNKTIPRIFKVGDMRTSKQTLVRDDPHQHCKNNWPDNDAWYKIASLVVLQCRHPQVGERSCKQDASEDNDAQHCDGDNRAGRKEPQLHLLDTH